MKKMLIIICSVPLVILAMLGIVLLAVNVCDDIKVSDYIAKHYDLV